jgi:glycosyltransferase involved in cell wall biosynthesis
MDKEPQITILLASYNGAKYIAEQIESIIKQTYTNWQLFIRDDGSTDNSVDIIKSYCSSDARIHLITDSLGNLGSVGNFSALMQHIQHIKGYTMFSDQDDIWLPEKIETTLNAMLDLEAKHSADHPLLVYTNFVYVDESLNPIASKKDFSATKIKHLKLSHLLVQNPVYGCTMMINKKLLLLVGTIPAVAENHDYWIALTASAFGKIKYLDNKTILYRQHGKNISPHHDNNSLFKRAERIFIEKKNFEDVNFKIVMAKKFKKTYHHQLNKQQLRLIDNFLNFTFNKSFSLFIKNIKNGLRRQTLSQTILFYLTILLSKKKKETN